MVIDFKRGIQAVSLQDASSSSALHRLMLISDSKKWEQLFPGLETKSGHMGCEELLQFLGGLLEAIPGKDLDPRFPGKPGKILRKDLNLGWEIP